ncbi:hypothetical protein PPERSA_10544 [Pseudocohnilembus persalinus]|uniref:Uncharacterized protein n=1 Tax=Pseudocohnilembus persalinus TaxID=266149 RepID=A0A0V0QLH1_PSEPJ|nr:hypothetical protein PPERSA_10544 [Pseudocohnilembus persalinus]|eukprot:KRX03171.1 hypothetical protein PPERSA_10544 [Pseudocohnilembus persalinus]
MGCGNSRDQNATTKAPTQKTSQINPQQKTPNSTQKQQNKQKQISINSNQQTKIASNMDSPQKSIPNFDVTIQQDKQSTNLNKEDKQKPEEKKENYYDTHIVRVQPHFPSYKKQIPKTQENNQNLIKQSNQQTDNNQQEQYTPIFAFSKTLKSKKSKIIGKNQKIAQSKGDLQSYILIDQPLNTNGKNQPLISEINFKINSQSKGYNIFMGICHVDTIQMAQFIKKKWLDEIDHGIYGIDDFGHCYSNTKEKFNNKKILDWGFSQEDGAIIQIQLCHKKKELTFKKYYQQKNYKPFVLPVSFKEVKNEGNLHFFVCIGGETQVQIIDENDLQVNLLN